LNNVSQLRETMSFIKRTPPPPPKAEINLSVSKDFSQVFAALRQDLKILEEQLGDDAELVPIDDPLETKLIPGVVQYVTSVMNDSPDGTDYFSPEVTQFVEQNSKTPRKSKKVKEIEELEVKISGAEKRVSELKKQLIEEQDHDEKTILKEKLDRKSSALSNLQEKLSKLK